MNNFKNDSLIALWEKHTDYPIEHWLIMYEEPVTFAGTYEKSLARHEGKILPSISIAIYMDPHPDVGYKLEEDQSLLFLFHTAT